VAERRFLGTRWSLFSARITTYLAPMAPGRQPRPFNSQSRYARRVVIQGNRRRPELRMCL